MKKLMSYKLKEFDEDYFKNYRWKLLPKKN